MRVTIVCLNYPPEPTGIALYTGALADGLAARGVEVTVVTGLPHYPQWRRYEGYSKGQTESGGGITVVRRRHVVPAEPGLINRLAMELSFGFSAAIARWRKPEAVLLVSPALFSSILAALRALFLRCPVVVWVQDIYSFGISETGRSGSFYGRILASAERMLFRKAHAVVVIHERFKRSLICHLGIDPNKVSVIRNWSHIDGITSLSASDRSKIRRLLGWSDDRTVVLHAGNMGAKQGLENVVEASRIADQANLPVLFVLMGSGNQRADLQAMGSNPCLRIIDPIPPELFPTALRAADVLLVNERGGVTDMAVPSKLTSYFATGLPVIAATDAGSVTAEEIELSSAGIRIDPERPELLVNAALEFRHDPQGSAAIGAQGPHFRSSHLMADVSLRSFQRVLSDAAVRSSSSSSSSAA